MNSTHLRVALFIIVCSVVGSNIAERGLADEAIDFARDVQPILSDRCYVCHGPDAGQRASDLRLDQQESAHALAITPGVPEDSELVRRITSDDPDEIMPPPDSLLKLTGPEKQLLTQWVKQGGRYAAHWAFVSPVRAEPPRVERNLWLREELDRFILARLEAEQMSPAPAADAETLIRRVTLDLTGLPPTPEEIDDFLRDCQSDADLAYEELVDRLLASKRYGEHMAVDWLDVSRYADTYGYQNDRYRPMWPWRDWVIDAFNRNLPYDDFVEWQIAGDLLPEASREQILATAFNRNHRQTNEGGSVEDEFRSEYVADRVNTFGASFLGLTLECCRCHDHKYDPLSQRDYYQLAAFFNSIDESGLYSHFTEATPTPTLLLPSPEEQQQLLAIEATIIQKEAELESCLSVADGFQSWRAGLSDVRQTASSGTNSNENPSESSSTSLREQLQVSLQQGLIGDYPLEEMPDGKLANRVDGELSGATSDAPRIQAGRIGNGVLLDGENSVQLPQGGQFSRNQPFTVSLWVKAPKQFERAVIFHRSRAWTDSGSRGYELLLENGHLSAALVHFWPGNALRVVSREKLPINQWVHVAMRYDGSSHAAGLGLFIDGQRIQTKVVRDSLTKHIKGADGFGGGDVDQLAFGQRFRDVGFKNGMIDELKVYDRQLSELELRFGYLTEALPQNVNEVLHNSSEPQLREFFNEQSPAVIRLRDELRSLRDRRSETGDRIAEIMVMRELPQPRPTYVLNRGAYDSPGELVDRGVPDAIFPRVLPAQLTRLELAKWLVDPQHPLTARVAVNRFWQSLFGHGIVATAEDFGMQGTPPTHPDLLDWLSVEFVESGWDVKQLMKSLVMSATYRQSSNPTPELLEHDPENRLYARGPALRLSAEAIRDTALYASGLLVEQLGGPPVKPYQPEGLWEEKSGLAYVRDTGEGSHRRSIYTYFKRTSPPPNMLSFDMSNREVCVVRRQATNTPLQTLVLLNDPQYVEAARALAESAIKNSPDLNQRLEFVYRRLTGRRPDSAVQAVLQSMYAEQRQLFASAPDSVELWLSIGDHRSDLSRNSLDTAALAVVANGLMSFDETLMKR